MSSPPDSSDDEVTRRVRTARRSMARLLRAVQASGRSVTSWPDEVVTRLAHVDAVTARHLIDPDGSDAEAAARGAMAIGALQRWVRRTLTRAELADVRAFELRIRIEDAELEAPLLRPDGAPEEQSPTIAVAGGTAPRSLRSGLRTLTDGALAGVCRRLGVRPLALEGGERRPPQRATLERAVAQTLRDDHLLSILVATLSRETHEVLAALVRARVTASELRRLAAGATVARVSSGDAMLVLGPLDHLRVCGLAYGDDAVWVPVELQRRLDGVLRTFGV